MLHPTASGYLVRDIQQAPTVPCPCGTSTRPLTRADTPTCNLHVTFIRDSVRHYHKKCTEVYYILEGIGLMEVQGDEIEVKPGIVIYIEPNTPHRLASADGVRALIVGIPALDPEDEYFDDPPACAAAQVRGQHQ